MSIKGLAHDGHAFAGAALVEKGASVAVVSEDWAQSAPPGAYIAVADPLKALERPASSPGPAPPPRSSASPARSARPRPRRRWPASSPREGRTHAPPKSFNNHIGVPLTLARMPAGAEFGVFEIGMNHAGEITPAHPHGPPGRRGHYRHRGRAYREPRLDRGHCRRQAEIFVGVEHGGVAVLPRDNRFYERLAKAARAAGIDTIVSFGEHEEADVRLMRIVLAAECSTVSARVMGTDVTYKFGAPASTSP